MKTLCGGNGGAVGCKANYAVNVNPIMPDMIDGTYNKMYINPIKFVYTILCTYQA